MREYLLEVFATMWLTGGIVLLIAPRAVMHGIRELTLNRSAIFRWKALAAVAGLLLLVMGWDHCSGSSPEQG
jgi:hypothetical protein